MQEAVAILTRECDLRVRYEARMLNLWLAAALSNAGISQTEMAARLTSRLGRSIDRSAVNKMVSGKRAIAADELLAISEITGAPAPGSNATHAIPIELPVAGLPILGKIQAGAWLDTALIDPASETEMLQVMPDIRFPRARQYVLLVVGDSMDLEYPDGSYVTCVDFAESGLSIKEGMTVHVERREADGQRVEITLKQVRRVNGGYVLQPRSSNPLYKAIPLNGGDGATEVVIKGVVTGGWKRNIL